MWDKIQLLIRVALVAIAVVLLRHEYSSAEQIEWIQQFGTPFFDGGDDVSVDSMGDVYLVGRTAGNLGGMNKSFRHSADVFLRKYDHTGRMIWHRLFGTVGGEYGTKVYAGESGAVFVAGYTDFSLDGPNYTRAYDAFLRKYDCDGNLVWGKQFGTELDDKFTGVTADAFGNTYVAGITSGNMFAPQLGAVDMIVMKLDTIGNVVWSKQFGTTSIDFASGVSVDGLGNVYVSGLTYGSMAHVNAGISDAFLTKFDSNGDRDWTRQLGSNGYDAATAVATDMQGNIYISGNTEPSPSHSDQDTSDGFLGKFDASGNQIWLRQFGTDRYDVTTDIAVDSAHKVYVTGDTQGHFVPDINGFNADAYVGSFDNSGNLDWFRQIHSEYTDSFTGVFADGDGHLFISGGTSGNLGGTDEGGTDALIVKLAVVPEPNISALAILLFGALSISSHRHRRPVGLWNRSSISQGVMYSN